MKALLIWAALAGLAVTAAPRTGHAAEAASGACAPGGNLSFVCGPKNSEDLVLLPAGHWIVASGMAKGGGLHLIDPVTKAWRRWAPAAAAPAATYPDCKAPPDNDNFEAHGLSLRDHGHGHETLYVVAHGERESIEVFDIDSSGAEPSLTWQGCVRLPLGLAANSVTSASDGSIYATVLLHPGTTMADSFAHRATGAVYVWRPGSTSGFMRVWGTELPTTNGIEISTDDKTLYVVSSGMRSIYAFTNTIPVKFLGKVLMPGFTPDNVHWTGDGKLISAGMRENEPACGGPVRPVNGVVDISHCTRGYIAATIDPVTLKTKVLAAGPRSPDYTGTATALVAGHTLWLSSFATARIGYRPLP